MITSITLRDNSTNSTICCNPIYSARTLSLKLNSGDSSPNGHVSHGSVYSLMAPNPPSPNKSHKSFQSVFQNSKSNLPQVSWNIPFTFLLQGKRGRGKTSQFCLCVSRPNLFPELWFGIASSLFNIFTFINVDLK